MSLDVTIFKAGPHKENNEWSANVTHNLTKMAQHIPVYYTIDHEEYENTLYYLVWRPEEYNCDNTDIVAQALQSGIAYMVLHREELLQYNPSNGWGSYDSFLLWLIEYWKECLDNPGCKIEVYR